MAGADAGSTYYEILGVSQTATSNEIKAAYKRLSLLLHPDRGGTDALFRELTKARDVLLDPGRRRAYDERRDTKDGSEEPSDQQDDLWHEDLWHDDAAWGHDTTPPGTESPPPSTEPPWQEPPPWQQPPSQPPPWRMATAQPLNGFARASVWVLLLPFGSIFGLCLGILGWRQIKASGGAQRGLVRAAVAISFGAVGTLSTLALMLSA